MCHHLSHDVEEQVRSAEHERQAWELEKSAQEQELEQLERPADERKEELVSA